MVKIISAFFILSSLLYSQNRDFDFEKITTKDGLNQNTVTVIMQDQQGYLWFGTPNGLNRYDGYSFNLYRNFSNGADENSSIRINAMVEDENSNIWVGTSFDGLSVFNKNTGKFKIIEPFNTPTQSINSLIIDSKNNIWVGTSQSGIKKYDTNFKLLEHYKYSEHENSISSNNITSLHEDEIGNIWIGTFDAGLNMLNPESKNIANIKITNKTVSITSLNQDKSGNIWIGTEKSGLILLDKNSGSLSTYKSSSTNQNSLAQNTVHSIFKDSQNRFWVGTENGLSLYNQDKDNFQNFHNNPTKPSSLSGNQILDIFEDRSGIMWISANQNGLNRFSRSFAAFKNYHNDPLNSNSLSSDEIWYIHETNYNNIWIGSSNGLIHWNRNRNTFENYPSKAGSISHDVIRVIDGFKNDQLIVGTDGGGINIFNPANGQAKYYTQNLKSNSISNNLIRDFIRNEDGTYWVATMDGLNLFDPDKESFISYKKMHPGDNTSLPDNRILDLEKDTNGNIWIATYDGLCVFYSNIKEFKSYKHDPNNTNSISNNETINLFYSPDENDIIWVSTEFGLNKFEITSETWTRYVQDDQANNVIYSITQDHEGFLWLGTNQGISRFNKKDGTFRNFDQNDGIRNYEFNSNASARIKDGSLLLGGLAGITGFQPSEMQKNIIAPNIAITAFKKFGDIIQIDSLLSNNGTLELTYEDKYISIEFSALDFNNSSKNQYKYILEGFDKDWINAGTSRSASYTNLSGGEYTFRVIGSNNDGVWNTDGTSLKIRMTPPFWTRWWFQAFLFASVFILVYIFYRNRTLTMKRQRHELQKEVSTQTRELFKSNLNLQQIQYENQSILENVEEGLFILNKEMVIQSQYSTAFLEILETESPAGVKLIDLLGKHLPDKDMSLTRDYLDFVFDHHLDEELIKDLNPLHRLEFSFVDGVSSRTKILTFKFKRIKRDNKVSMLIVTVIDNTKEYRLSQQLELNEEKSKAQVELLMGVLHLDAGLLNEFMEYTYEEIAKIENLLQTGHKEHEYKKVLNDLEKSIGFLKQNAINIDLKFFLNDLLGIESKITKIYEKEKLTGMDFLPLVLQFKEVKKHLDELKNLVERITKFSSQANENIVLEEQ